MIVKPVVVLKRSRIDFRSEKHVPEALPPNLGDTSKLKLSAGLDLSSGHSGILLCYAYLILVLDVCGGRIVMRRAFSAMH